MGMAYKLALYEATEVTVPVESIAAEKQSNFVIFCTIVAAIGFMLLARWWSPPGGSFADSYQLLNFGAGPSQKGSFLIHKNLPRECSQGGRRHSWQNGLEKTKHHHS
jgi:hypothetical protein